MIGDILGGLGGLVGGIAGLAGGGDEEAKRRLEEIRQLYAQLGLPRFNMEQLRPEELSYVGDVSPEGYDVVNRWQPRGVTEGPEGRAAQLDSLGYFSRLRDEGLPELDRLAADQAAAGIGQQWGRGNQAITELMRRRGMGGGGNLVAAQIAQQQGDMDLARGLGDDLVRQQILARLEGAGQAGALGGQMRAQDLALGQSNADVWNRYGEWLSNTMTDASAQNTAWRNAAQARNVSEQQRLAEANAANRQGMATRNQEYLNSLRQQGFGNELAKIGGIAGANQSLADQSMAAASARQKNLSGLGQSIGQTVGGVGDLAVGGDWLGTDILGTRAAANRDFEDKLRLMNKYPNIWGR